MSEPAVLLETPDVATPEVRTVAHTPLPLPVCKDPRRTLYAVALGLPDGRPNPANTGFWPAKLLDTPNGNAGVPCGAVKRAYLFPKLAPGQMVSVVHYETPKRNVTHKANIRGWYGVGESAMKNVKMYEYAGAALFTKAGPVVAVSLWCPVISEIPNRDGFFSEHGAYAGVGETPTRMQTGWEQDVTYAPGLCPKCGKDPRKIELARKQIAKLLESGPEGQPVIYEESA